MSHRHHSYTKANIACAILAIVALVSSNTSLAQDNRWALPDSAELHTWDYVPYAGDAGMTGEFVFEAVFDGSGVLWVATSAGLKRFDGLGWRTYTRQNGLPSDFVRSVFWDEEENLLLVGTDLGIARGDSLGFSLLPLQPESGNVRRIRRAPDGSIWVCSDSWLRPSEGGLTVYRDLVPTARSVPEPYVADVYFLADQRTILLTANGVWEEVADGWERLGGAIPGFPRDLALDRDGALILSTPIGTFTLAGDSWTPIGGSEMRYALLDNALDGSVVAISSESFFVLDNGRWLTTIAQALPGIALEGRLVGPDSALWLVGMGTLGRFGPTSKWVHHPEVSGTPYVDRAERLWMSGDDGLFLRRENEFERIAPEPLRPLSRDEETTWLWDREEVFLFGPNGAEPRFSASQLGLSRIDQFRSEAGTAVALQIDSEELAVARIVRDTPGEVTRLSISDLFTSSMDESGRLWLAWSHQDPARPTRVVSVSDSVSELPGAPAMTSSSGLRIYPKGGTLTLLGDFGLAQLEEGTWRVRTDVPSGSITNLFRSGEARWIAHRPLVGGVAGLTVTTASGSITLETPPLRVVGPSGTYFDGTDILIADTTLRSVARRLPSPPAAPRRVVSTREGDLWASTADGVYHLHVSHLEPETLVKLMPEAVLAGQDVTIEIESRLPWGSQDGLPRQSSWRLNDGDWSPFEKAATASISTADLPPGTHALQARARSVFGVVDRTPAHVEFRVMVRPLQSRRWFWPALLALFGLAAVSTGVAWLARNQLAQFNANLEDMVTKRTVALARTREQLEAVFAASPNPIVVLDASGSVRNANPAARALMSLPTEELLGTEFRSRFDLPVRVQLDNMFQLVNSGQEVFDRLIGPVTAAGADLTLTASAVRIGDTNQILWIGTEIGDRIRAQRELRRLSMEIQRVQETERRALARDLHDEVGGGLTILKMSLLKQLNENERPSQDYQKSRIRLIQDLMERVRSVSLLLRPTVLDRYGLAAGVREMTRQIGRMTGIQVGLRDDLDDSRPIADDVESTAYRIIQESLSNAAQHSGASHVEIRLSQSDNWLVLEVRDDGAGFEAASDVADESSSGLAGMRNRAIALGGHLIIDSQSSGTTVRARLPLDYAIDSFEV